MNSEPVRLRSRVSARRGQGYFTPLAACSIKGGGGDAGIGDINSVAAKHLNDGGAGRFAINCCAGYGIILSSPRRRTRNVGCLPSNLWNEVH
jgi:hypothetical protein